MKSVTYFITALLLLFTLGLFPQKSSAQEITIAAWKTEFWKNLRSDYCSEDSFFKNCFSYEPSTCEMKFQKSFLACESKLIKVSKITPAPDGVVLGRKMGRCIASNMTQSAEPQKKAMCKKRRGLLE